MTMYSSLVTAVPVVLQLFVLVMICWTDISSRVIPNNACLGLAAAGALTRLVIGPVALLESVGVATGLFVILLALHARGGLGGGDVKLLTALAIGQSFAGTVDCLTIMALAGGILVLAHLALRRLPRPKRAPVGAGALRRVYSAERWRILRRAPLPYGIAIACGGFWTILMHSGS